MKLATTTGDLHPTAADLPTAIRATAAERLIYETGKHILSTFGLFEEETAENMSVPLDAISVS